MGKEVLPEDITRDEILPRVSWETLDESCSRVCKLWRSLIHHDPHFQNLHHQKKELVSGYFVQSVKDYKYITDFIPNIHSPPILSGSIDLLVSKNLKIEASSRHHGLLCCVSQCSKHPRYYVCKPTTQQWRSLPNPRTRFSTHAIAMVVEKRGEELHYKIVRFFRSKPGLGYHCEIFDSNNMAWKSSRDVEVPDDVLLLDRGYAILAHGAFHWLTDSNQIFAFNVNNECWDMIELPEKAGEMNENWRVYRQLVEFEGRIAVLYYLSGNFMELWVMGSYTNRRWRRQTRVSLESMDIQSIKVLDFKHGEIALMDSQTELTRYDATNGATKLLKQGNVQYIHPFTSDTVPVKL